MFLWAFLTRGKESLLCASTQTGPHIVNKLLFGRTLFVLRGVAFSIREKGLQKGFSFGLVFSQKARHAK